MKNVWKHVPTRVVDWSRKSQHLTSGNLNYPTMA